MVKYLTNRYLVNNAKEFEWIQLYLFSRGFSFKTSTYFPILVEVKCYESDLGNHTASIYYIWENKKKISGVKNVSNMMRKDKIKKLKIKCYI